MGVKTIVVEGSHQEMGIQYGEKLKEELYGALSALKYFFITQNNMSYENMLEQANTFHARYSNTYSFFLEGIAQGSGLTFDDVKILNGMETIKPSSKASNKTELGACSFIFLPPSKTYSGESLMGRNYDFCAPYDKISENITVSILKATNQLPTAIIGMPGQIYCPSCVNSEGLFMALNNGMPSGGYSKNETAKSLLINMLHMKQSSNNLNHLATQLLSTQSDYSLIINTANKNEAKSFEFSSTMGLKAFCPNLEEVFVSTNYYQNITWENIPKPSDQTTWLGVSRYNNLMSQASLQDKFNVENLQDMLNTNIEDGGAFWNMTIYQMIYDSSNQNLYITRGKFDNGNWTKIPLAEYFCD